MAKCIDCGFLSLFNRLERSHEECHLEFRQTARVRDSDGVDWGGSFTPCCFMDGRDLRALVQEARLGGGGGDAFARRVVALLAEEFDPGKHPGCEFSTWHRGFTPKEHREMLDRQAMLKWQEDRLREERDWQVHQREQDRQWRIEDAEQNRRSGRALVIATLLAAAITAAVALGAARLNQPPIVNNYINVPTPTVVATLSR